MADIFEITGRIHSTSQEHVATVADEILDEAKGKKQSQVNAETDATLAEHTSTINGLNSQNYVTVTATDQTTAVTDVLPATGEVDTVYRVGNWDGSQYDVTCYSEYSWNGTQYKHLSTKTQIGEVFDISAYHATGGTLATYADLAAALDSNNGGGVPQSLQKGGMSVKFVQSSDNNYIQARCMAQNFTTDVTQWQGVDDEPVISSENLVKSGGVATYAARSKDFIKHSLSVLIPESNNIFNVSTAFLNYSVSSSDGSLIYITNMVTSNYIKVESATKYTFKARWIVAWYDDDLNFISGSGSSESSVTTLTSPADAKYMRFSFNSIQYNPSLMMVNKGETLLSFDAYKETFNPNYLDKQELVKLEQDVSEQGIIIDEITIVGNNIFDYSKEIENTSISSSNGTLVEGITGYASSNWIEVKPSTDYSFKARWTVAWYNENKQFISASGSSESSVKTLTSPANAAYMRFSYNADGYVPALMMVNEGSTLLPFEPYTVYLNGDKIKNEEYETVSLNIDNIKIPGNGFDAPKNLCLIAAKNIFAADKTPDYPIFLYLELSTQKLYISNNTPDNPVFLCDWDNTLADYENCQYWMATITNDNDIIFLRSFRRRNPVIYPHTDYNSPYVVDFGDDLKPAGYLMSPSIVQFSDGSFVFGDYRYHSLEDEQSNDPRNIWRVVPPYNNKTNWMVAHRFKHVYYASPISDEPDNEIGHIHAIQYDWYEDVLYCTTGDIDRHCRLWYSTDKGVTWQAVPGAVGWVSGDPGTGNEQTVGQKWRFTGMIFTKDAIYWATDSFHQYHCLYKVTRDNNGIIDATSLELLKLLEIKIPGYETQATYFVALTRAPYGILIVDRAEPRTDGKLDIKFYDIKNNILSIVNTLEVAETDAVDLEQENRIGLPNQFGTQYQPEVLDSILIGGGTVIRPNNTSLFNNAIANYVGALKLKMKNNLT